MNRLLVRSCLLALIFCAAAPARAAEENIEPSDILFWPQEIQIEGYRSIADNYPTRRIPASDTPLELPYHPDQLNPAALEWSEGERANNLNLWMDNYRVVGAIVVHKGRIIYESYRFGNTEESRWISFSVAKSVTSMLMGAAVKDGYINSVDDPVTDYLPQLRGSGYEKSSVKDIMQMASGVAWDENYFDAESDVSNAGGLNGLPLIQYMSGLQSAAEPGTKFNYSTGETNLAGSVLRSAIGNNASEYLTHRIWQPFGMEHDAYWLLEAPGGGELGGCCLNATLRDYARIGLFAMGGGRLADGTEVLADHWMQDSVTPSAAFPGYGYFWWLSEDGTYDALGIFGQMIHIDPERELVIAFHGAWEAAVGQALNDERVRAVQAIVQAVDQR